MRMQTSSSDHDLVSRSLRRCLRRLYLAWHIYAHARFDDLDHDAKSQWLSRGKKFSVELSSGQLSKQQACSVKFCFTWPWLWNMLMAWPSWNWLHVISLYVACQLIVMLGKHTRLAVRDGHVQHQTLKVPNKQNKRLTWMTFSLSPLPPLSLSLSLTHTHTETYTHMQYAILICNAVMFFCCQTNFPTGTIKLYCIVLYCIVLYCVSLYIIYIYIEI